MSPGERAPAGRREPARPQYAAPAPFPYYPPYGVPHNAWLGAPLMMAGRQRQQTPISKLAIQAQGAPLIIQNRQDRRKFVAQPEQRNHRPLTHTESFPPRERCERSDGNRMRNQQQPRPRGGRPNNADAVSVASDESSGSTNSETMLPRIIKPRKRRKKDRKPNNIAHDMNAASLDIGDVDQHCGVGAIGSNNIFDESYCNEIGLPYRLNVKVLDYQEPVSENYRISALEEALEATRFGLAEAASPSESATSSCQCRYCDPIGQIWDADAIADLLDESSGDFLPTKLEESMKVVGPMGRRGTDSVLRRSWSDPFARAPERRETGGEASSAPNLYSLFPPVRSDSPHEPRSPLALEISSEIVTSMNGQRDLEIKLFSSSPPAVKTDRRSFFVDSSESSGDDRKVSDSEKTPCDRSDVKQTSEEVSESGCPSYKGYTQKQCDLTLITA